ARFSPELRHAATGGFNMSEKVYIDAVGYLHDKTSAREYTYYTAKSPVTISSDYRVISMPSYFDLRAGVEYRAMKNLGIFARANNIFNSEYERFLYYPRLGFNLIGGLNYSF